ncbi:MogA/MoaB family molybdenum cofactor biosynthesis protein [Halosolutus gelatinilyticus]|uniref:MogA/MoaB family molybdenum cofactor biosynthesis protein n=1 Tax=Halosolutus gelatinilyticus TaxID=2931975 RepID=UPI001FF6B23D|nr:molybdopterin-binding protein [Halosolutus gelatinilyticus]
MTEHETNGTDAAAGASEALCAGVVTIADERDLESDEAGEAVVERLERAGHEIALRDHVGCGYDKVQSIVERMIERNDVDLVLTAGATSVEPDDVTLEAVEPLLEKKLTAFDEVFTMLGYEQVGTRIVAARTLAGISDSVPVFCLPGHPDAVALAIDEIILPEGAAIVDLAREDETAEEEADGDRGGDDGA